MTVSSPQVSELCERDLIARITSRLPPPPDWLVLPIGDDAAVVVPERNRLEVLTVDALVEGIHFDRRFTPAAAIGHRAMAANLSDLAAMGAEPRLALLSPALPLDLPLADFDAMIDGCAALAARHRLHVAGGNLTRSPGPLMLDITAIGSVKRRQVLTRAGARPGDEVWVSGTIGAAAAGLQALRANAPATDDNVCVAKYLSPEPRVRLGMLLGRNRAASSCMDLSDGLADGLRQLSAQGGVGIEVEAKNLPIDAGTRRWFESRGADPLLEALAGGDDYELVFTVRPRHRGRLRQAISHGGVPLTRIGACTPAHTLVVRGTLDGDGPDCALPQGFRHFR